MTITELIAAWRLRRRWPTQLQLEHLRLQVQLDSQWLSHNPVAAALCARYADMLADDWYRRPVRDVAAFRDDIGCNPHRKD